MVKLLKKAKRTIIFIILFANSFIKKAFYGKNRIVFLIGTPWHGNVGDQAIALAEILFIKNNTSKIIIEVPSQYMVWYKKSWKKIIGDCSILIHGGGFIGSLWPAEDEMARIVLSTFPNNNIIILPQTIYFYNSDSSKVKEYLTILNNCRNTVICAREKYSYEFSKKIGIPNVKLVPDMVTYFNRNDFNLVGYDSSCDNTVLLCLRNDLEKVFDKSYLKEIINNNQSLHFVFTDTCKNHAIYPFRRKKEVTRKICEFSRARLVITDRLHGMVFAALANTPCIVLSNCNYKILGVHDWISNNENIIYIDNLDKHSLKSVFERLINMQRKPYNNKKVLPFFVELKHMIEGI